jgi:hypothetical protein
MKRFFSSALCARFALAVDRHRVGCRARHGHSRVDGAVSTPTNSSFTEPAWVLGGFSARFFLVGSGSVSDWMKWARGIDTPDHHEDHHTGWEKYVNVSLDHKVIGIQYTIVALLLISIGGLFALIFRTELPLRTCNSSPRIEPVRSERSQLYNTLMSLHGMIMIVSILLGIAGIINYAVPLLLGAHGYGVPAPERVLVLDFCPCGCALIDEPLPRRI